MLGIKIGKIKDGTEIHIIKNDQGKYQADSFLGIGHGLGVFETAEEAFQTVIRNPGNWITEEKWRFLFPGENMECAGCPLNDLVYKLIGLLSVDGPDGYNLEFVSADRGEVKIQMFAGDICVNEYDGAGWTVENNIHGRIMHLLRMGFNYNEYITTY